jgi:hypothetical protein
MSDGAHTSGHGFPADPVPELGGWSLAEVAELAERAHTGQVDKSGSPYLEHPVRIAHALAERGAPALQQALGLLHDTVEDTATSLGLLAELGLPQRVLDGVDALTHRPGEPHDDYYRRVRANLDALPVKLADLDDNGAPSRLSQLDAATQLRLTAKYAHARSALLVPEAD